MENNNKEKSRIAVLISDAGTGTNLQAIIDGVESGKIKKIGKGAYTKHNESSLAVFSFGPAYIGLQSSLSHHRLWEQETIPVIITVKKVRRGVRGVMNSNILVRNIDKKYLFGFDYVKEGDFYLPYSDIEKTFIDLVFFNQPIDKIVLRNISQKIDRQRLENYLKKYPLRTREKVMKRYLFK